MKQIFLLFTILNISNSLYAVNKSNNEVYLPFVVLIILAIMFIIFVFKKMIHKDSPKHHFDLLEEQITELNSAHKNGIISSQDYNASLSKIEEKREEVLIDQLIKKDSEYIQVVNAHKNAFLTEKQTKEKISKIRNRIKTSI